MHATPDEIKAWRDMAIPILRERGPLSPKELGDLTGETSNACIIRARMFKNYFRTYKDFAYDKHRCREYVAEIDLVPALRVA